ncbi:hypothetical protein FNF27_05399 [Cafeteria roenbergensis]|uniref:Uncharacterized protein n=1 Tax=Cafeteria roenbergensis TaxID=33653 RepID=A0A5A8E7Q5_CAFRO|nr:hypothetical protein FNF31_03114 [Cafeteria roenbergensis]KAA0169676.1 hypothetical protein FNF28_01954 [Cafeteria roenbergensis]KAA0173174.1 hypothetical protein FNF27_05399 [Cafeteria roenbergensis]|mmetsp:Transcript_12982/g.49677  ORF Transcript_12982/g.49677 Transcript_12982/m.49677 type:complete len:241 (+) Transcript_12982:36-758(+)
MALSTKPAVIARYRGLLRTISRVFAADATARYQAIAQARQMIETNRNASEDAVAETHLLELDEAEQFIRTSVVQAALNDEGHYAMAVEPRHVGTDDPLPAGQPVWASPSGDDAIAIDVHVQPGAKSAGFVGDFGRKLKVRVTAQPTDGGANKAVVALFRDALRLGASDVEVVRGRKSREKLVVVRGVSMEDIIEATGWEGPAESAPSGGLQMQSAEDIAAGDAKDPGGCGCSHDEHDHRA